MPDKTDDKPENFQALFPPLLKAKRWSVMTPEGFKQLADAVFATQVER